MILYGYEVELKEMVAPALPPYMVVYAYDMKMNSTKEVAKIKEYAKKEGLKIVSPGFYHKWADYCVNVEPVELMRYFKFAECVVTDTFHGAVMSIINGRELAVRIRDNGNKLLNLLDEYGLTGRVIDEDWNLDKLFSCTIDYGRVNREIFRRRADSMDFLKRMVELKVE